MAIDRTADFMSMVRQLESTGEVAPQQQFPPPNAQQNSEFNSAAAEIGRQIDRVQLKLGEFRKLAKRAKNRSFNDNASDLDRMTAVINNDIQAVQNMVWIKFFDLIFFSNFHVSFIFFKQMFDFVIKFQKKIQKQQT